MILLLQVPQSSLHVLPNIPFVDFTTIMSSIPELDPPEKILKGLSSFNSLIKSVFSTDLKADVPQDDPQALNAGVLGDLVSQAGRFPQNAQTIIELVKTSRNHGLTDDKKYLVREERPLNRQ